MLVLSRRVEHPLDVTVQRSNDADAREHRWTVMFCNQQKRPHRGLPFGTMFCLGPITSAVGTNRTNRAGLLMSVNRGRPEVTNRWKPALLNPKRTSN
jgi:hypothetical protein